MTKDTDSHDVPRTDPATRLLTLAEQIHRTADELIVLVEAIKEQMQREGDDA